MKDVNEEIELKNDYENNHYKIRRYIDVDIKEIDNILESYKWKTIKLKRKTSIQYLFKNV